MNEKCKARDETVDILSPTHGVVEKIEGNDVFIYISPSDNHDIYAPIGGRLVSIETREGYILNTRGKDIFYSDEDSVGRAMLAIKGETIVSFYVEVGKGYITHRIRIDIHFNDLVDAGSVIGVILLGSRSQIEVPKGSKLNVKVGDKVFGKNTVIATVHKTK